MQTQKIRLYLVVFACLSAILGHNHAAAQDVSHLPPEKADVVLRLAAGGAHDSDGRKAEIMLDKLDPIFVGKNISFSRDWQAVVDKNIITREQFEIWRNHLDKVFSCYEEFTGVTTEPIYIGLSNAGDYAGRRYRNNAFMININSNSSRHGNGNFTAMHEMAHCFALGKKWEVDQEAIADLLVYYASEKCPPPKNGGKLYNMKRERKKIYTENVVKYIEGKLDMFTKDNANNPSAYKMYLYALVDKIGWEPYKQAFHSYEKHEHSRQNPEAARDFLDRLEYFSGKPGVLRALPDKGALLDKYFNYEIADKNYRKEQAATQESAQVPATAVAAAPTTEKPKKNRGTPTRVWVNEEIEALNRKK